MTHTQTPRHRQAITRRHGLALSFLWLGYFCLLLFRIGYPDYPTRGYTIPAPSVVLEIDFGQPRKLSQLNIYDAEGDARLTVDYWLDGWKPLLPGGDEPLELNDFYKVREQLLPAAVETTRLRLRLGGKRSVINELALLDAEGHRIIPAGVSEIRGGKAYWLAGPRHPLFDEAELTRIHNDYRGNSYFDEIYHGRTAYEFVHHLQPYENTHPPLGKALISLGIRMLDMTPLGMRLIGALFGSLMPLLLFWGGLLVTGSRTGGWLAALLAACDFMTFTICRLATIDVFLVFFLTAMALCLYRWSVIEKAAWQRPAVLWLYGGGLFLGLAASVKWSALFVGTGIGLMFLWQLHQAWRANNPPWPAITRLLGNYFFAFILLPLAVYYLSYAAFFPCLPEHPSLFSSRGVSEFLAQQRNMFSYHSELTATHPFGSPFYSWPFIGKPLYLYVDGPVSPDLQVHISLLGNPIIWWSGLAGMVAILWIALGGKNAAASFIAGGYLVLYLPWMLVSRVTFIYHYYPSVPFLILGLAWLLTRLPQARAGTRLLQGAYLLAALLALMAFYPAISGLPVSGEYAQWLHWFDSWNVL